MLEAEEDFEACEVLWRGDLSVVRGFICGEGIYLWRGDLSPLGCEAAPSVFPDIARCQVLGPLRAPAGINPLATMYFNPLMWCSLLGLLGNPHQLRIRVDVMPAALALVEQRPDKAQPCLLYTSPSPRDGLLSRMPSSA